MTNASHRGDGPVLVVGGGIVGLATAYYLLRAGVPVEVVERSSVASGASLGNAGWVCATHSAPVASPGVAGYALRSLGRPDSPLYLRPSAGLLPWLLRFWRSSGRSRFERGYAAVVELNRETFALFDELAESSVDTGLSRPGMVHAFLSVAQARHYLNVQRLMARGRYEVPDDVEVGDAARELDPSLKSPVAAAYFVPGEGIVHPERFARSLRDQVEAVGGKVHEDVEVSGFQRSAGRIAGLYTSRGDIACGAVVIAAGMWSGQVLRWMDRHLPLQTGKGYSFSIDLDPPPAHSIYFGDHNLVASPMAGTTRIAGTMELSGNNNRLDWRRIVALAKASRHYLGDWFSHADELPGLIRDPWVGGRPLLPDTLPVIDQVPGYANAFVNTGHGMLGVTLGPASGRALTEFVVTGRRPGLLEPFRFDRLRTR
ncbi:MAG TPA: FAD-dependent oxidoreductase [Amycolatopsis sp.]|uniref:NAD(P)/FAD-dependent oxidoreductase n=1 Tax=Amycolatopsis sp. TaxID=37632 RepID=UPI002B4A0976|nr:FAD-dependent oxidoreductase [Amycolatopsis sp.]HKS46482.1 FAD-dependent oxidoreductase [Amycolatopsis sp.]